MPLTMKAATHENAMRFASPPLAKSTGDDLFIHNEQYKPWTLLNQGKEVGLGGPYIKLIVLTND